MKNKKQVIEKNEKALEKLHLEQEISILKDEKAHHVEKLGYLTDLITKILGWELKLEEISDVSLCDFCKEPIKYAYIRIVSKPEKLTLGKSFVCEDCLKEKKHLSATDKLVEALKSEKDAGGVQ